MNTTKIVPIALFAALFFPAAAHAEVSLTSTVAVTATTPTVTAATTATVTPKQGLFRQFQFNRKEMREDVKENRKEIRDDVKEIRKDIKGTENPDKTELRRKLLTTSQNGLLRSFTVRAAALEKYQKLISERITQKLVKYPGNQDLLKAQASLSSDEQKTLWATFKADVAKYEVSIKAIASSSDPKSLLNDLRAQAKKINEDLKAIRQFLVADLRLVVKAK